MRKILLISLAAVIVAGGIALVTYAQDKPEREGPPRGRPRGGRPPRIELTKEQSAALKELMKEGKVGAHLMKALTAFQEAVKGVLEKEIKDEAQLNRAVRRFVFQAIMQQMRPPADEEGNGTRRLDRRR
ncbi:unnamed protein product, partial [marine sediment metagenome]